MRSAECTWRLACSPLWDGRARCTDLKAWQHATSLSDEVDVITARLPAAKRSEVRDPAQDAAASAPGTLPKGDRSSC